MRLLVRYHAPPPRRGGAYSAEVFAEPGPAESSSTGARVATARGATRKAAIVEAQLAAMAVLGLSEDAACKARCWFVFEEIGGQERLVHLAPPGWLDEGELMMLLLDEEDDVE